MSQSSSTQRGRHGAERRRGALRRARRLLVQAAFAVVCLGVLGIVLVLTVLPRLTGGAALTVLTGSMTPGIPVGSVVVIRPVDPGALRIGDVATYQVEPDSRALITHRVLEVRGTGADTRFVFKGDANPGADSEPVPPQAIRGEVWFHVPYLGTIRDAVQGRSLVLLLTPPLLGLYAFSLVLSGLRDRRRGRRDPVPPVGRRMVAARFRRGGAGLADAPDELARRWDGVVLDEGPETFTVLVTSDDGGFDPLVERLRAAGPEALWSGAPLDPSRWRAVPVSPVGEQREVTGVPA